jgi:RNA polymerase sigma factor (sigma-70 family)
MTELSSHRSHVLAVAMAIVRDRTLAEDIVQDTFVIAFAKRAQLRDPAALTSWLASIARNRARDALRAQRREHGRTESDIEEVASNDDTAAECTRAAEVRRVLAKMPARYRDVLLSYYGDGESVRAIATRLGISEAATLQRLSRGRKRVTDRDGHLRELAILVIALTAARRAEAAPATPRKWWLAPACVLVFASWSDLRAERAEPPIRVAEVDPPPPPILAVPAPLPTCPAPTVVSPQRAVPHRPPPPTSPTVILQAPTPPIVPSPPAVLADVALSTPAEAVEPTTHEVTHEVWYAADGWLENAALPPAGSYSFDMQGDQFLLRRGVTDHVELHVGFAPMDMRTSAGSTMTTPVALLGVGVKVGATLRHDLRVAAIVEGSREWHSGTTDFGDRGIVRTYAALTYGDARVNATLEAGFLAVSEGDATTAIPMYGIALQAGFADHAAVILEQQSLLSPLDDLEGTTIVAMRAHTERGNLRVRFDLGTMLVSDVGHSDFYPWFQTGISW